MNTGSLGRLSKNLLEPCQFRESTAQGRPCNLQREISFCSTRA